MFNKLIGNKAFYKRVMLLTIPIMIQQGITNFVNMLDNVMVGTVGQAQSTGVAVSNQLIFVFNLCIYGAISGAGIFTAQYFGKGDSEGVKQTFRFKIIFCSLLSVLGIAFLCLKNTDLIMLYLNEDDNAALAAESLGFAKSYLYIMIVGLYVVCFDLVIVNFDDLVSPSPFEIEYVEGVIAVDDLTGVTISTYVAKLDVSTLLTHIVYTVDVNMSAIHKHNVSAILNELFAFLCNKVAVYMVRAKEYLLSLVFFKIFAQKIIVDGIFRRAAGGVCLRCGNV